jgi:hypothetical protein
VTVPHKTRGKSVPKTAPPDAEDIAKRAYFYWLERGCPEGSPEQDWLRAEAELRTL